MATIKVKLARVEADHKANAEKAKAFHAGDPTRAFDIRTVKFPLTEGQACDLLCKLEEEQQALFEKRDELHAKDEQGRAWQYNTLAEQAGHDMLQVCHNNNIWSFCDRLITEMREMREVIDCLHKHAALATQARQEEEVYKPATAREKRVLAIANELVERGIAVDAESAFAQAEVIEKKNQQQARDRRSAKRAKSGKGKR